MKYNVHLYPAVHIKVCGIEAQDMITAAKTAEDKLNLKKMLNRHFHKDNECPEGEAAFVKVVEDATEAFMVDVADDKGFDRSQWLRLNSNADLIIDQGYLSGEKCIDKMLAAIKEAMPFIESLKNDDSNNTEVQTVIQAITAAIHIGETRTDPETPVTNDSTKNFGVENSVQKYLDISTAHITEEDTKILTNKETQDDHMLPIIIHEYDEGYFINVSIDSLEHEKDKYVVSLTKIGFSEAFINIMLKACSLNCYWVRFDGDTPKCNDLPEFEW